MTNSVTSHHLVTCKILFSSALKRGLVLVESRQKKIHAIFSIFPWKVICQRFLPFYGRRSIWNSFFLFIFKSIPFWPSFLASCICLTIQRRKKGLACSLSHMQRYFYHSEIFLLCLYINSYCKVLCLLFTSKVDYSIEFAMYDSFVSDFEPSKEIFVCTYYLSVLVYSLPFWQNHSFKFL